MTSANVIEYTIFRDGKSVGSHRQNLMCKSNLSKLLDFQPLSEHTILAWGYDEEDEYWEDEDGEENLEDFLKGNVLFDKEIKEYFKSL